MLGVGDIGLDITFTLLFLGFLLVHFGATDFFLSFPLFSFRVARAFRETPVYTMDVGNNAKKDITT
jgi:hypothetical protein